ncbi:hypothetical protein AB0J86_27235 [Micromonospora sp. NPDC049559]|uniref:hypothetical protein n=1 Tax=Micromonospora sp. NPDC049559 TaxID=3155923 RepID=UPI00341B5FA1
MTFRAGDAIHVGAAASVQFADGSAILVRLIRVENWPTYHGWAWLDVYVIDRKGVAIERRHIYVQLAGLRPVRSGPAARPGVRNQRTYTTA